MVPCGQPGGKADQAFSITQFSTHRKVYFSVRRVTACRIQPLGELRGDTASLCSCGGALGQCTPGACRKAFAIRICGLRATHLQREPGEVAAPWPTLPAEPWAYLQDTAPLLETGGGLGCWSCPV